jgi:gluconate:H+ symporter, GntP family
MAVSFLQVLISLLAGIVVIVILTTVYRLHAFFALMTASVAVGLGMQIPLAGILTDVKEGFGNIMKSLGPIIVLGTTLGVVLENTGSTRVMADFILKKIGRKNARLGISITGLVAGLPIFCDSGFIVLNGLNTSLAKRTGIPVIAMATSLATGLYSVHCLIPPHPGAAAAATALGVDFGKLMITGIIVAIPAMLTGYWWAGFAGRRVTSVVNVPGIEEDVSTNRLPSVTGSFLPVIVPVILIAFRSFFVFDKTAAGSRLANVFDALGDPIVALSVGVLLSFAGGRSWTRSRVAHLLQEAAEKAGGILVIIGAGGAFGSVLAAGKIGQYFSQMPALGSLGILFPFLLTFVLKTAQGSSTVAIITAASVVQPLLPALGLESATGKMMCVLSMGAGSMMISHANDAYFWVISRFSGLEMKAMFKVYSIATLLMGLVAFIMLYILSLLL